MEYTSFPNQTLNITRFAHQTEIFYIRTSGICKPNFEHPSLIAWLRSRFKRITILKNKNDFYTFGKQSLIIPLTILFLDQGLK